MTLCPLPSVGQYLGHCKGRGGWGVYKGRGRWGGGLKFGAKQISPPKWVTNSLDGQKVSKPVTCNISDNREIIVNGNVNKDLTGDFCLPMRCWNGILNG